MMTVGLHAPLAVFSFRICLWSKGL